VVVDRATIEKPLEKGRTVRIDPIDSSKNFDNGCDSNKYVYLLGKGQKGDPWINMGDSHACGSNYMFWGEDGVESNIKFKNENKGVQIYVGGQYPGTSTKDIPHNPTHHRAPGKGRYQSTYKEAEQVCMALGKKVCSVPQLEEANKAGYGNCDCGWTSTKKDKDHRVIAYPTNIDIWGELQFDPKKRDWCGKPGMNTCGVVTDTGGVRGHMGADIYCCDKYDFDKEFKSLEIPYSLGMVWVTELEQQFSQTYSVNIPTGTKFVVFNDKYGLALQKTDSDKYELISHPKGRAPKEGAVKAQIPPGAMDISPSTHAVFLDDLPAFDIKAGSSWTPARASDGQVSYGSRFKIRGSRYLTGFPEVKKEGLSQVYGTAEPNSDSTWVIQPVDAEHGLVRSGDTVKLEHVTSKQHLASNPVHTASSGQRVYMDKVVDSDDYWRVELSPGDHYLKSSSKFRLVHVNTNKVLDISQSIVNGKMLIIATPRRTPGSLLTLESLEAAPIPHDKCEEYLNKIIKTRQLLQSGHPMTADLYRSASSLRDSYNSECYKISMKAYEMGINPKIERVRKEMDELNRQLGIYEKYHNAESELAQTQSRTIAQQEEQEAELTKLLNKHCLPVKQCIVPPDLKKDVSPTCQSLSGLMRSHEITDDLIHEIQKIRRGNDSIANYDIRNHRDYYKLSKASHVEPC
jgi:hypothetical protein